MGIASALQRAWRDGFLRVRAAVSPPSSAPEALESVENGDRGIEGGASPLHSFASETRTPARPAPDRQAADEPSADRAPSPATAWLRIVEEEGGAGVRAALFLTSGGGEAIGFSFTRRARSGSVPTSPPVVAEDDGASLAGSLLRSAVPRPVLVLGPARETAGAFRRGAPAGSAWGCVRPVADDDLRGGGATSSDAVEWSREPEGDSARRLWGELVRRARPFEPLERAGRALAEAFADPRVEDLTAVEGLSTVVALYPPPRSAGRPGADGAPLLGAGLAERLWAILVPPAVGAGFDEATTLAWPVPLMPFQREGVGALLASERLLLADDMGLGKTVQAIAALRVLFAKKEITSCLVAAPASLLDQWRREIDRWAPELSAIVVRGSAADRAWQWAARVDVALVSYDTLRSDVSGAARTEVAGRRWDVVVADEAQRIKNRNDTSDALKGLWRARSWALTGTPIENHEEELASILEFVDQDESGATRRYRPGAALSARHRELQLRRRKGDVLDDLPTKQTTRVRIALTARQRASYDRAERDGVIFLRSLGAEVGVRHVLELITRLKQICNADPQTGESSKLDDVKDRLAQLTAQGHRALVFSQYANDASGVGAAVRHLREFNPLAFTGEMTREERTAVVDRFRADTAHKVLVLSLRAGGLGLNLQEASYVFHLDRWWNPAVERQAEDRSHRIGQTVKVNVIAYSCAGTIEERIDGILERKRVLFEEIVDDVSLDLSERLNHRELLGLFGLE